MFDFLIHEESEHDAAEQQPSDLGVLYCHQDAVELCIADRLEKPQLQEELCNEEIGFFLRTSLMSTYLAFEQLLGARVLFGLHDS